MDIPWFFPCMIFLFQLRKQVVSCRSGWRWRLSCPGTRWRRWLCLLQPTAISVFLPEKANGVPARSMSPVPLASVRLPKGRGAFRQLTFGFSGRGRVSTAADAAAGVDTLLYR
uniref:DUF3778 domain-containing protein n=1 Tax=Oryza barthii TaxID=65489 RepID=A0A0D3F9B7_9ORYZ